MAYAQRVVDSERVDFEKQHGWTIKTMEREPSPVRDEYAPVIFSQETVSHIASLDMMSGEVKCCDFVLGPIQDGEHKMTCGWICWYDFLGGQREYS